jgi:RND superfamily putative drug exporter
MKRLDRFLGRHRRAVLAAWALTVLAAVPFAMHHTDRLTGAFNVPGSQSNEVRTALQRDFDRVDGEDLGAVLVPVPGASAQQVRGAIDRLVAAADDVEDLQISTAARRRARDATPGDTLIVPLRVTVDGDRSDRVARDLRERLAVGEGPRDGVAVHLIGEGGLNAAVLDTAKRDAQNAERLAFPVLLLILVVAFGSIVAALLPIGLAVVAITLTSCAIYVISQAIEMSIFTSNIASLIGIGVAVDYSLFVLARYREDVAAGHDPDEARVRAMSTSGVAVMFSGAAVVIALAGLLLVSNTALRSMALGAMIVVAVAVAVAVLLLPLLIRLLGRRAYSTRRIRVAESQSWRWTSVVTRRPAVSLAFAATILVLLAIPALSMDIRAGLLPQLEQGSEARAGVNAATEAEGPTAATPTYVLLRFRSGTAEAPANREAVQAVRGLVSADPLTTDVAATRLSRDGKAAVVQFGLRVQAETDAAKGLVRRLRGELEVAPASARVEMAVGGIAARWRDVEDETSGSMWKVFAFVLGLAFVVLLVLLRAPVVSIKAVLMILLSVGAAYGVLVAIFQWGWLAGPLGLDALGYIDPAVPPLVFAIVFGLSMDYQVFLLTRVRERWQEHGDTARAVDEALARSARTITAAAVTIAAVFATFVFTGVSTVQQTGLGCAVAILIDATLVRLVLVPSSMQLLGDRNWWQPSWLRRPRIAAPIERLGAQT